MGISGLAYKEICIHLGNLHLLYAFLDERHGKERGYFLQHCWLKTQEGLAHYLHPNLGSLVVRCLVCDQSYTASYRLPYKPRFGEASLFCRLRWSPYSFSSDCTLSGMDRTQILLGRICFRSITFRFS